MDITAKIKCGLCQSGKTYSFKMFFVVYLRVQNALPSQDSETQHTSAQQ